MLIVNAKNRGYYKIKGAADAFNFDFRDKIVLDIGSSTGGFTEYALDRGAEKVIAIEKGTNQMKTPLRYNPRVELHEKTDILDYLLDGTGDGLTMAPAGHPRSGTAGGKSPAGPVPDIVLADVSFISLTKILKHLISNLKNKDVDYLVMLKPQFEARPDQLHKGIIKNEKTRREIIKNFEHWLKDNSLIIINKRDNKLEGRHGNQERFYWLKQAKE